jgi:hypothetical protein
VAFFDFDLQCIPWKSPRWEQSRGLLNDAMVFIGQHAMAGPEKGILAHTQGREIRDVWVNHVPVGEFGLQVMLGATYGIPNIMLSGDAAACKVHGPRTPSRVCGSKNRTLRDCGNHAFSPGGLRNNSPKGRVGDGTLPAFKAYCGHRRVVVGKRYETITCQRPLSSASPHARVYF